MSILAWIEDQRKLKLLNTPKYNNPTSDGSQGLWTRCDHCGVILYIKHLKENQRVCFGCGYHLQMNSQERIEHIIDLGSWRPLDETLSPCDPLEFRDQKQYTERLKEAQERTGLQDAIQTGTGMLDGIPVALGVMDFNFMGGSMGSVVGEKITRLIEYATQEGLTLILVCASGGARMQEGILSLMQMAKISAALQIYQSCANLLYISVLTSPTTGGVTASFAMLGDLIFAEPKALIGFAGRRVIEQTLQEQLPDDFQTAEYLLHHGLLDLIVPRSFLKQALSETITLYKDAPFKESGIIPHGIQQNLGFLKEEKVRRKCKNWSKNLELYQTLEKKKSYSFDISKKTIQKNLDFDKNETSLLFSDNKDPQLQGLNLVNSFYLSSKESPCDSYYREILLSFQTIFNFFENTTSSSKTYIVSENLADFPFLSFFSKKDNNKKTKKELVDENRSSSFGNQDLKESEILVQEQQEFNNPISFANSSQELIKNSISRANSEIIEWRALYLNQNIQSKITFLEYLTTQTKTNEQKNKKISDKKFFYNYKKAIY